MPGESPRRLSGHLMATVDRKALIWPSIEDRRIAARIKRLCMGLCPGDAPSIQQANA
jgi:hypothetical protein